MKVVAVVTDFHLAPQNYILQHVLSHIFEQIFAFENLFQLKEEEISYIPLSMEQELLMFLYYN